MANKQRDAAKRIVSFIHENNQFFKIRECCLYCQYSESENKLFDKERLVKLDIDNEKNSDPQDRDCVCGRRKSKHSEQRRIAEPGFEQGRPLWSIRKNTEYVSPTTFGEIVFHDKINSFVEGARSKFLRLEGLNFGPNKPYLDTISKLMLDKNYWAMPEPRLIIEVTGTAKDADIEQYVDSNVVRTLKKGIVKAARDASAWIVSGASNCGVMRLVGDEVAKYHRLDRDITCLGIVTWGCANKRADLISDCYIVDYNVDHNGGFELNLNHGHNYFLLVDNAREKIYGEEIYFRHELINHIAEKVAENLPAKSVVPVVMLALGGGLGTLQTLEDCFGIGREPLVPSSGTTTPASRPSSVVTTHDISLSKGTKPVVILYGFGGATDVLADVYTTFIADDSSLQGMQAAKALIRETTIPGFLREETSSESQIVKDFIRKHQSFPRMADYKTDAKRLEQLVNRVFRCYEILKAKKELLTVYQCSSDNKQPLNEAILRSALKNNQTNAVLALQLARLWKATDAAKDILMENRYEIVAKVKESESLRAQIGELVQDAIALGQAEFLTLLFNYKVVNKDDFLTHSGVFEIYRKVLERKPGESGDNYVSFLRSIADSHTVKINDDKEVDGLRFVHLGSHFSKLVGCFCLNFFLEEDFYQAQLEECYLLDHQTQRPSSTQSAKSAGTIDDTQSCISRKSIRVIQNQSGSTKERKNELYLITKYRDVFLLQLAMNQQAEADFLWKNGHDVIGTALAASIFLKNLAKLARRQDRQGLADIYSNESAKWGKRAEQVLNECNEYRQQKVSWLLTRNLSNWQNRSVFEIAFYGRCMEFVKHEAVQLKLRHIWFGRISAFTRPFWVYLASLCPVPFLWMLKFIPYDVTEKQKAEVVLKKSDLIHQSGNNNCHVTVGESLHHPSCFPKKVSPTKQDEQVEHSNYKHVHFVEASLYNGAIEFCDAFKSLWSAAMVRYFWNVMFLLFFLLLFSSFILTCTLSSTGVTVQEGFVLAWAACFLLDLVHETYADDVSVIMRMKTPFCQKVKLFFRTVVLNRFNIFDWSEVDFYTAILPFAAGILLLISFILRMVLPTSDFIYPRTTYALTCFLFWLHSMRIFNTTRTIGIIVVILSELLMTLLAFLLVYAFLLLAFSIPTYALMSPKRNLIEAYNVTSGFSELGIPVEQSAQRLMSRSMYDNVNSFFTIFVKVVYNRWWNLVQFNTDSSRSAVEGVCPSSDSVQSITSLPLVQYDDGGCDSEFNFVAVILYIVFIFMTNIAWLNVLIATLSERVGEIRKNAEKLSKFNYFVAVRTVYYRCYLPPPISIIEIVIRIILFFCRSNKTEEETIDFLGDRFGRDVHVKLDALERRCAELVLEAERAETSEDGMKSANDNEKQPKMNPENTLTPSPSNSSL